MRAQKYGKKKPNDDLFDFAALLVSSSPHKQANNIDSLDSLAAKLGVISIKDEPKPDIDSLAAQLETISIAPKPKKRVPLESISTNVPTSPPPSVTRKSPRKAPIKEPTDLEQLLQLSLDPAHQSEPQQFKEWSNSLEQFFTIVKIAEASYGEVYRLVLRSNHPDFRSSDESVLKVLALKTPPEYMKKKKTKAQEEKEYLMSSIDNVMAEVKLLQRMVDIPGFTNFRDIRVLKGKPSTAFAQAWKKFNAARSKDNKSVFPDPSKKSSYSEDQLWAVIEMQDAGMDLENIQLRTVWTIWDVFWGVTLAIAKGEQEAEFEHRDLHMGNICVKSRKENGKISPDQAKIRGFDTKLNFSGIETTIIDYTLSRAETASLAFGQDADHGTEVEFMDLSTDNSLFEADATEVYQYEIYRYMRSAMYFSDPLADFDKRKKEIAKTGRTWAGFHPQTNLVWLHFVLHELLQNVAWPSRNMKLTMEHVDVTSKAEEKLARQKAKELERTLKLLRKTLRIDCIPAEGLESTRDLVAIALEEGWLDEEDVVGADCTFATLVSFA